MSESSQQEGALSEGTWAKPVETLTAGANREGVNLVEGKRLAGPVQGFGKLWQKTYRVRLAGVEATPAQVIAAWREGFGSFWPKGNDFYPPLTGLDPGEVALLSAAGPAKLKFKTGVMVLYADEVSFTLMTPEGHMFAGWITFSAFEDGDDVVAQAQVLMRASDPIFELGLTLGGHAQEDHFWQRTLTRVAEHYGHEAEVETQVVCVDKRRQWSRWRNVWQSAAIRSALPARRRAAAK
jgi:hypothetical protein